MKITITKYSSVHAVFEGHAHSRFNEVTGEMEVSQPIIRDFKTFAAAKGAAKRMANETGYVYVVTCASGTAVRTPKKSS